jgi:hypothetical protein
VLYLIPFECVVLASSSFKCAVLASSSLTTAFYHLVQPSLTKAVLQSAVMLMVREKLDENTKAFILALFKRQ